MSNASGVTVGCFISHAYAKFSTSALIQSLIYSSTRVIISGFDDEIDHHQSRECGWMEEGF
jgi:hypothetical protein